MADGRPKGFFLARFGRGLGAALDGLRLILGSGRMFTLALLPFLICLALYAGFFVAVVLLTDDVVGLILEPGAWWRTALRAVLFVVVPLTFLVIAAFSYTTVSLVVGGPLYEGLSAAAERRLTGHVREEPFRVLAFLADTARAVAMALALLAMGLAALMAGLVAPPFTTALALGLSAVLLAFEFLDYPMGRRRMPLRARTRFARRHAWELLGLGLPLLLGSMVPLLAAACVPVGVVGGTLLFLRLRGEVGRAGTD